MPTPISSADSPDFLLFEGGPFSRLRALVAERVEVRSISRPTGLIVLITWVPMAVLAALQGIALGPSRPQSMLLDAGMYARFWVALPVLLTTSAVCGPRLRTLVQHFREAGLVKESAREQFDANIRQVMRSAGSPAVEVILLVTAYLYSLYMVTVLFPALPSWRTLGADSHLSWAAWWLVGVSQPLYIFVALRFLYRLLLWWRFLRMTSRLELDVIASHPDGAGGFAFLGLSLPKFGVPAFAISAGFAGGLANLVLWAGMTLKEYQYTVLAVAALLVALLTGPLLFFYVPLKQAKFRGRLGYGLALRRQLRPFEQKWIASQESDSSILNAQDFSAVTDYSSIAERVNAMRVLPFQRKDVVTLALSAAAPFLVVVALEIPVQEIVKQLMRVVA